MTRPAPEDFASLLDSLKLVTVPDVVVVCDGSGTTPDKPCGWAAAVYDRVPKRVEVLTGCASNGTNNTSELQPVLSALWLAERRMGLAHHDRVLVVSDSEVTVKAGRGEYSRDAQGPLWAAIDHYVRYYDLKMEWVWVPRNSNTVHVWCDEASREMRLLIQGRAT